MMPGDNIKEWEKVNKDFDAFKANKAKRRALYNVYCAAENFIEVFNLIHNKHLLMDYEIDLPTEPPTEPTGSENEDADDHDCHLSPEDGCDNPSHNQI